jgi:hypothetical protein
VALRDANNPRAKADTSCRSCLAWGMTRYQDMCRACYDFSRNKSAGDCGACRRREPLKTGYCRLCWVQASLDRQTGPDTLLMPYVRRVRHQQLFLACPGGRIKRPKSFGAVAMPGVVS